MGQHNPFLLFRNHRDGWCAAPPGFRNLLRDPVGCGRTRAEAVKELLAHPEFVHRAQMGEWPSHPGLGAFVETPVPTGVRLSDEFCPQNSDQNAAVRCQAIKLVWDSDARR